MGIQRYANGFDDERWEPTLRPCSEGRVVLYTDHEAELGSYTVQKAFAQAQMERAQKAEAQIERMREALRLADKMKDWFMHMVPEWDTDTQTAIDHYEQARAALERE